MTTIPFAFNRNSKRRSAIIGTAYTRDNSGGIRRYKLLALMQLRALVNEGFADPNDQQNDAPSLAAFLGFMSVYPFATAHGYTIEPKRDDYRVSVEGISGQVPADLGAQAFECFVHVFERMFSGADEYDPPAGPGAKFRIWYD